MCGDGRERRDTLREWGRSYHTALSDHPQTGLRALIDGLAPQYQG
jgi:hypothetical protein